MKLTALPLLEKDDEAFEIQDLSPSVFCNLLDTRKALVLQNKTAPPFSVEDFGSFLVNLKLTHYPYIGGAAPRTNIPVKACTDKCIVFTANESPPEEPIPFHHEIAQVAEPPTYLFFYCEVAPETGGQTPIIDSVRQRKQYSRMNNALEVVTTPWFCLLQVSVLTLFFSFSKKD